MKQKGFTLIELVIVLSVLGVLAAVAVPQLTGLTQRAELVSTANVVSSEISNSFALDLSKNNPGAPWVSGSVCSNISETQAPSLSGYSLADSATGESATVSVPTYDPSTNSVSSTTCQLTAD